MTAGGPENATISVLMLIYRYAFLDGDYGRAGAPQRGYAIHDALLSAIGLQLRDNWLPLAAGTRGATFAQIENGSSVDL